MDQTTLNIANALRKRINEFKKELEILKGAPNISSVGIKYRAAHDCFPFHELSNSIYMPGSYETFRNANILYLEACVADAEKDFENL